MCKYFLLILLIFSSLNAENLEPLMLQKDKIFFNTDNEEDTKKYLSDVKEKDGMWKVEEGVLTGMPLSVEHLSKTKGHNGSAPSLSLKTPPAFCASFKVQWQGLGIEYKGVTVGMASYGSRIQMTKLGTHLTGNLNTEFLVHVPDYKLIEGKWYECFFEIKGESLIVQFKDGPVIFGQHEKVYGKPGPYSKLIAEGVNKDLFKISGTTSSTLKIKDLKVWTVKEETQEGWLDKVKELSKGQLGPMTWDRDKHGAALNALIQKDQRAKEILALRKKDAEIKAAGKEYVKKQVAKLSPEDKKKYDDKKAAKQARLLKEKLEKLSPQEREDYLEKLARKKQHKEISDKKSSK